MNKKAKQVRHGDVLLTPTTPPENKRFKKMGKFVAALGEVTGHSHVVYGPDLGVLSVKVDGGRTRRFIELPKGGKIEHEEHGVLELKPGFFEVIQQQEWLEQRGWQDVRD